MKKLRLILALSLTAVMLSGSVLTGAAQADERVQPASGWPPTMWELIYQWCWENIGTPETCGTQPAQWPPTMWDIIYQWCWENVGTPEACGTSPRPMTPHMWVAVFSWCVMDEDRDDRVPLRGEECWRLLPSWPPSMWMLAYQWCWQNVGDPDTCGTVPPRPSPGPRR
jgi:hypothetical protein